MGIDNTKKGIWEFFMWILLKVLKYIIKIKGGYENIFRFASMLFFIFEKYIS